MVESCSGRGKYFEARHIQKISTLINKRVFYDDWRGSSMFLRRNIRKTDAGC